MFLYFLFVILFSRFVHGFECNEKIPSTNIAIPVLQSGRWIKIREKLIRKEPKKETFFITFRHKFNPDKRVSAVLIETRFSKYDSKFRRLVWQKGNKIYVLEDTNNETVCLFNNLTLKNNLSFFIGE